MFFRVEEECFWAEMQYAKRNAVEGPFFGTHMGFCLPIPTVEESTPSTGVEGSSNQKEADQMA
jgi:hypothetical protein